MSDAHESAVDAVVLAARDQARSALLEITEIETIGADAGYEVHEERVITHYFVCTHPGYVGWRWAATLARVDDESAVNVLEVELLPGPDAVTAPEWLPWSERLAKYRDAQARLAADEAAAAEAAAIELEDEDEVDPDEDLLENDFSDFDDDLDGVDFEEDEDEDEDEVGDGEDDALDGEDDEDGEDDATGSDPESGSGSNTGADQYSPER